MKSAVDMWVHVCFLVHPCCCSMHVVKTLVTVLALTSSYFLCVSPQLRSRDEGISSLSRMLPALSYDDVLRPAVNYPYFLIPRHPSCAGFSRSLERRRDGHPPNKLMASHHKATTLVGLFSPLTSYAVRPSAA